MNRSESDRQPTLWCTRMCDVFVISRSDLALGRKQWWSRRKKNRICLAADYLPNFELTGSVARADGADRLAWPESRLQILWCLMQETMYFPRNCLHACVIMALWASSKDVDWKKKKSQVVYALTESGRNEDGLPAAVRIKCAPKDKDSNRIYSQSNLEIDVTPRTRQSALMLSVVPD